MTRVYFDTEFTGLHKNTTLISIGMVSDCHKTFYAEFGDYDHKQVDEWIKENVISKLLFHGKDGKGWCNCHTQHAGEINASTKVYGNAAFIGECLKDWFGQFENVEMWSDCLAYDWVLFNDIFGDAFKIPENIYYIPFDISTVFQVKGVDPDISREEYAYGDHPVTYTARKHNALWDAQIIKLCHDKLIRE